MNEGNDEIVLETRACFLACVCAGTRDVWHSLGLWNHQWWRENVTLLNCFLCCCTQVLTMAKMSGEKKKKTTTRKLKFVLLFSSKALGFANEQMYFLLIVVEAKEGGVSCIWLQTFKRQAKRRAGAWGLSRVPELASPAHWALTQTRAILQNSSLLFQKIPVNLKCCILLWPSLGDHSWINLLGSLSC